MAYSKNERKLKAFLSKQDDTRKPSTKIKNNPVFWVVVRPSQFLNMTMRYRLVLLFADLLTEDKSNRLQVQSDQHLVALDVLAKLKLDNDYNFNTQPQATIEFFQERFDDFTAGVSIDVEITSPMPLNLCQVPTTT